MNPDAVVIGAGPAGSVAARELARRGVSVLLVDKAKSPRPKVCGCCLNGSAVGTLKALGLGHVLGECRAVPLHDTLLAAGRRAARVPLPAGVAVSRDALDAALIREAVAAGATFLPETSAKLGAERDDGREVILTRGGRREAFFARVVVAASGLAGRTDELAAHEESGSRIGAGVVVPADAVPEFFRPGTVYMATAAGGYVGLVRVEDGRLDVAAAFDPAFVRRHGKPGFAARAVLDSTTWPAVPDLESLTWKGTPPLTRRPARLGGRRVFVVGDAAGYVEPFTGEGMAWAVTTAAALAPLAARVADRWTDSRVREWERLHARLVGRRQRTCRIVARVLRSPFLTAAVVRTLAVFPFLSRPVVAGFNRPPVLPGPRA